MMYVCKILAVFFGVVGIGVRLVAWREKQQGEPEETNYIGRVMAYCILAFAALMMMFDSIFF